MTFFFKINNVFYCFFPYVKLKGCSFMQHFSIKNIILIKDLAHTGELTITET